MSPVNGGVSPGFGAGSVPATRLARRFIRRQASDLRCQLEMRADPSYRRMARRFEFPDGSRRVYLYHVRKTAGTSLFLSFLGLGGEDPMAVWRRLARSRLQRTVSGTYSFASNDRSVLAEGAYFFGRSHRPFAEQPLPRDTFTVTILRDPVARVHSYFDYLVAGDNPSMPGRVSKRQRLLAADGFDAFLDRVPIEGLLTQLAMFSPSLDISEATGRIAGCSSTFFTEDFVDASVELAHRLGLPLVAHQARVTATRSELTVGQQERLRTLVEPEYELLRRLDDAGIGLPRPI